MYRISVPPRRGLVLIVAAGFYIIDFVDFLLVGIQNLPVAAEWSKSKLDSYEREWSYPETSKTPTGGL